MKERINEKYDLPESFAAIVEYYAQHNTVIRDKSELLAFWQKAINARQEHPELEESIAEWAMSCAANSPLINDCDIFEQIHFTFGELEIDSNTLNSQKNWKHVEELVAKAHVR